MSGLPKTRELIQKKSPLFVLSHITLEKSNPLNIYVSFSFKNGYNLFELFYNEDFEDDLKDIGLLLNEIKNNKIPILSTIDGVNSTIDDVIKFFPTRNEENSFETPIKLYLLKSEELDDYFENLEKSSNEKFMIDKSNYSYDDKINKLVLNRMNCWISEEVEELSEYSKMNDEIKVIINQIEKDKDVSIGYYLNKVEYGYNLEINFRRRAEKLFECEDREISFSESNLVIFNDLYQKYFAKSFRKLSVYKAKKYYGTKKMTMFNFEMTINNIRKSIN